MEGPIDDEGPLSTRTDMSDKPRGTRPTPSGQAPFRTPFFYGWAIVGSGCLAECLAYGVRNSFAVFYVAILNEFGWGRADTALIFSAGIVAYGLTAPVSGALVDRLGPRRVMPVGALLLAAATAAASQANAIWQLSVLFALVCVGTCLTGFVPNAAILARWFVTKRGRAFGLLNAGWGSSFIFVIIAEVLISSFGWRSSYLILAAAAAIVLIPLNLLIPRSRPEEMGLLPDGGPVLPARTPAPARPAPAGPDATAKQWASTDWTFGRAIRTYRFWATFLANLSLWGIGQNLVIAHQVAFAVDLGISVAIAATVGSLFGIMSSVGALGGHISDRVGRERAFTAGVAVALVGMALLIASRYVPSAPLLYVYAITIGIGLGVAGPALTSSVADLFAGRNFGSINGAMVLGFGLGGSIGPWLGGFIFDTTGEYVPAFAAVMLAMMIAVACLWVAGPRQVRPVLGR